MAAINGDAAVMPLTLCITEALTLTIAIILHSNSMFAFPVLGWRWEGQEADAKVGIC